MTVSVAMAACNGEKYIAEQIASILPQLNEKDELIVSVNPSSDQTEEIVTAYSRDDTRIKVFPCPAPGVLANFENAIQHCSNEIIFLSDQDDLWMPNKVSRQLACFRDPAVGGVCHDCTLIDSDGNRISTLCHRQKNRRVSSLEILWKNPVQGCCLAFRREYRDFFLPFPHSIPMHDSWIGLWICKKSILLYLDEPLLLYRQHAGTVTTRKHGSLRKMTGARLSLLLNLFGRDLQK